MFAEIRQAVTRTAAEVANTAAEAGRELEAARTALVAAEKRAQEAERNAVVWTGEIAERPPHEDDSYWFEVCICNDGGEKLTGLELLDEWQQYAKEQFAEAERLRGELAKREERLREIHGLLGRGDGHGSVTATANCAVSGILDLKEEARELAAENESLRQQLEAAEHRESVEKASRKELQRLLDEARQQPEAAVREARRP